MENTRQEHQTASTLYWTSRSIWSQWFRTRRQSGSLGTRFNPELTVLLSRSAQIQRAVENFRLRLCKKIYKKLQKKIMSIKGDFGCQSTKRRFWLKICGREQRTGGTFERIGRCCSRQLRRRSSPQVLFYSNWLRKIRNHHLYFGQVIICMGGEELKGCQICFYFTIDSLMISSTYVYVF